MKKIICFGCLFLLLLCAAPLALAADETAVFSVTVPAALPVAVGADGSVSVATDARIVNNSAGTVTLDAITIVPQNSWRLDAWGTDYSKVIVDSKQFSMQFCGDSVPASGNVDVSGYAAISAGGSMALSYDVRLAAQTANLNETIARVIFTVSWDGHGPLAGIAVTTAPAKTVYDAGDAFDGSGMIVTAIYTDSTTATVTGWTVTDGATLAEGQTSVTVSYTEGGVTRTATVPITVNSATLEPVYAILYSDGELVFQRGDTPESGRTVTATYSGIEALNTEDEGDEPWYSKRKSIKIVDFQTDVTPLSTAYWFYECTKLMEVKNADRLNTSLVTNMECMFDTCESLETIDPSGWNTANVVSMRYMFSDCDSLTSLDLSRWDTSSLRDMFSLFSYSKSLEELCISTWNTSGVTNMRCLFTGCKELTSLDLSGWDVSSVRDMSDMFASCTKLTAFGGENWTTSSATNMSRMFSMCSQMTDLQLSAWDTSNVTTLSGMFENCRSLTTLDISTWNTGIVQSLLNTFHNCYGLKTLDLSSWDTSTVTDMAYLFDGCTSLTTIWASDQFVTNRVMLSSAMFQNCPALIGGNGTAYSSSATDATYARIDRAGTPGYFTEKTVSLTSAYKPPSVSENTIAEMPEEAASDETEAEESDPEETAGSSKPAEETPESDAAE